MRTPFARAGASGAITGIDLGTALRLAELAGYDLPVLALLLPMASSGIVAAAKKAQ